MRSPIVPFFIAHQGCPQRCIFCDQRAIAGSGGELPASGELLARIERYARSAALPLEIAFFGGTFTSLPHEEQERLLAPLQPLRAAGTVGAIRVSTRPDALDPETVALLGGMGVTVVELGIQSMDDRVLAAAGRGHTAADVARAFTLLRAGGIAVGAQLMPGLPGDSADLALDSLQRVLALAPAMLRIYPTLVLAGTRLAERYREGSYIPLSLDEAVALCAAMLLECRKRGVPVIRLGLQATAELATPGRVLAGPWHPAFRQVVEGELWYALLERLTGGLVSGTAVAVNCPPGRVSDVVGQKRGNLDRLRVRRGIAVTRVTANNSLPPHGLAVVHPGGHLAGALF